jgi:hypothetical protein
MLEGLTFELPEALELLLPSLHGWEQQAGGAVQIAQVTRPGLFLFAFRSPARLKSF